MANEEKKTDEVGGKEKVEHITHQNIYRALSWFQGEMKPIEKDGHVHFTTKAGEEVDFRYSTLGKVMEVINPVLGRHGLSVRWEITKTDIEAVLTHETTKEELQTVKLQEVKGLGDASEKHQTTEDKDIVVYGEARSGKLPIDLTKPDMKEVGAQITYGRRYTLGLVLGIATEEDKDTEILEQGRKNVENYAFKQTKNTIEKAEVGEELEKQIEFLKKELVLAEAVEKGEGKRAPSLGLKAEQYRTLIKTAEAKRNGVGEESQEVPTYIFTKEVKKWGVEAGDIYTPDRYPYQGGIAKLLEEGVIVKE